VIFIFAKSNFGTKPKITLTYWGLWEDQNTMNSIISDFEKKNPNIIINYQKQDIAQYEQRLQTRIQENASDAPDIYRFHNTWTSSLRNYLAPVPSTTMTTDMFQKTFYPVASDDLIKNNVLYGIPLEIDTLSLFINTDAFSASGQKAPTDLISDFPRVATLLTSVQSNGDINKSGVALGTYDYINHAPDIISYLLAIEGVDLKNLSSDQNQKYTAEALDYYTKYALSTDTHPALWSDKLGNSLDAFAQGNVAMYFGYSWDVSLIQAENKNLHFAVVPVPQLPPNKTTIASYWAEGVSSKTKHLKEAMLFLNFLAQKQTEEEFYQAAAKERGYGEPYARVDLASTLQSNPLIYPFVEQASYATSSYFAGDTGDDPGVGLNGVMDQYLSGAINSILSTSNPTSPQTAAQTLGTQVQQSLPQYGY
jgi:multiple sugar transport system substrate-binding protein